MKTEPKRCPFCGGEVLRRSMWGNRMCGYCRASVRWSMWDCRPIEDRLNYVIAQLRNDIDLLMAKDNAR